MNKTDQNALKNLVQRRHPEYATLLTHWRFLKSCYDGGREWFTNGNIFRYLKEGDKEFSDRLDRCYRFNHTREVVDLVNKYIFKMEAARREDAPGYIKEFWKRATLNNLSVGNYVKQISEATSIYGCVWIVVDNNNPGDLKTLEDEKRADIRTYSYMVTPDNVCDLSYDSEGKLNWILIHEQERSDANPFLSTGEVTDRFRLWERDQWTLFRLEKDDEKTGQVAFIGPITATRNVMASNDFGTDKLRGFKVAVDGPYPHDFGEVPVFRADHIVSNEPYRAPSLIDDIAYLDRAVANYLSNVDAIIQDQTFSQLTIPAQAMPEEGDGIATSRLVKMGTNRIFTYDSSGSGKPEYISPDVKQADLILRTINKVINEIYHSVGLAGERTKEDNALGIDNSSGVAKAYDFERVNSLLISKADSLEVIENKLVEFVAKWNGEDIDAEEKMVLYPDNFDVRGLYDEFEIAARLNLVGAPNSVRRNQMGTLVNKLFPQLTREQRAEITKDLKEWPPALPTILGQDGEEGLVNSTGANDIGGEFDDNVDDAQKGNRKTKIKK